MSQNSVKKSNSTVREARLLALKQKKNNGMSAIAHHAHPVKSTLQQPVSIFWQIGLQVVITREFPQKSAFDEVKLTAAVNTVKVWMHNATLCAILRQQSIISGVDNLYNMACNKQAMMMVHLPS